jgi:ATP-binding cassette, subfamily F, member 3
MRTPAVAVIELNDVSFGYGHEPLFEHVSFRLERGQRASLVAPNGAGKSTLLRLIAGELSPDTGFVGLEKDRTLAYYRQSHERVTGSSVEAALLSGFADLVQLADELKQAEQRATSGQPADLRALAEVSERYQLRGADAVERRVKMIATQLGFSASDLARPLSSLSGGERGRLELGGVLAIDADLLLLDEPTNHLDLDTIRWLEEFLDGYAGAVLVVSHDRAFLDNVCPTTLELGRRTLRAYSKNYSAYIEARRDDLEREHQLFLQQAEQIEKTEDFIRRNIAGQKTKQAQSRRKMLSKLDRLERPEDVWNSAQRVRFRFADAPRSGDIVIEAKGLRAERGGRELFKDVELLIRRGDRVGIVGPNGSGKSTLLRLLAGQGAAEDRGDVRRGTQLAEAYFDQHLGSLDLERSGAEEIRSVRGDLTLDAAREYLARFRFYGDQPLRKVSSLSGGERTRLALAKLLLEPRNLLLLDEPTNHLDIPATEILEEALVGFEGTVILVSHDRRLLENVTTRTVCFADGVDIYAGGFKDYVEALARGREQAPRESKPNAPLPRRAASAISTRESSRPAGKSEFEERKLLARDLEKKRKRLSQVEQLIAELESTLSDLRAHLKSADGSDWEKLHAWAAEERSVAKRVEDLMSEWTDLADALSRAPVQNSEAGN